MRGFAKVGGARWRGLHGAGAVRGVAPAHLAAPFALGSSRYAAANVVSAEGVLGLARGAVYWREGALAQL